MTTSTYKFGGVLNKCKSMQPTGDGGTNSGMLISAWVNVLFELNLINSGVHPYIVGDSLENDLMTWHMRNVTTIPGTNPSSFYHPWAYIGSGAFLCLVHFKLKLIW